MILLSWCCFAPWIIYRMIQLDSHTPDPRFGVTDVKIGTLYAALFVSCIAVPLKQMESTIQ